MKHQLPRGRREIEVLVIGAKGDQQRPPGAPSLYVNC